jgi:starvation-inducible DNA-binding protein
MLLNGFCSPGDNAMTSTTRKEKRTKGSAIINQRLAGAVDLQMQVKQAYWNVQRKQSVSLHELFDEIAKEVESFMDMAAERIVQLGGIAQGTVRVAAARSRLEKHSFMFGAGSHAEAVANALHDFGCQAREALEEASAIGDAATANLFAEICRGIDKWLLFVRAHSKSSAYRRKHEFIRAGMLHNRVANNGPMKHLIRNSESPFESLCKIRRKNQSLRKVITCQSSINSPLCRTQI